MTSPNRKGSRLRLVAPAAACLVLLGSLALLQAGGASAQTADSCSPSCVMMIQIDGLEAADVSPTTTPFLWSLAHPDGDGNGDGTPEVPDSEPSLGPRAGWIWQAPRASMTAGLAANAAAFLVGGYPEQTGIVGDDMVLPDEEGRARLGGGDPSATDMDFVPMPEITPENISARTILGLVKEQLGEDGGAETAAFIGDPNLGEMIVGPLADVADSEEVDHAWYPTELGPSAPSPQHPALCDVPRDPTTPPGSAEGQQTRACAANDAATLLQATQALQGAPNVLVTYIELAELGRMKRASTSVDAPGAMTTALGNMDTALKTFLETYKQNPQTTTKWESTVVMITGTSGYEQTLPTMRVPDPDDVPNQTTEDDDGQDLAHHVSQFNSNFELVPQGSIATVYPSASAATAFGSGDKPESPTLAHRTELAALKAEIETVNDHPDCDPDGCIAEVLYTRPELTPDGSPTETVDEAHPGWHLDHLKGFDTPEPRNITPSGRGGDLVVVMEPGWGAGKAFPTTTDLTAEAEELSNLLTNPYPASTGGPRNRAVAAIINGGTGSGNNSVKDFNDTRLGDPDSSNGRFDRYPVGAGLEGGAEDDPECDGPTLPPAQPLDVDDANATPEDDANDPGHWCQAEVLDFAPTVAAMLQVAMPADQICGRLLDEAFNGELVPKQDNDELPEAYFTSGPVTPPEGQTYPQSDKTVTFEFDATAKTRTIIDCGEETTIDTTFECRLDSTSDDAYQPCGTPGSFPASSQIGPLAKGIHEYCVRAVSGDLNNSEPECAKFEVIEFFDFEGILRDLRAKVTDRDGNTYARAPKKRPLNRIQISADYGRPLSAVTLTLYKQTAGKKLCGSPVFRPKEAVAAKSSRAAAAASVVASKSAGCPLTGLARFKPFKIDRGHVDLRLRIPPDYKPTHVGVTVQEVLQKVLTPAQQSACSKSQSLLCLYEPAGVAEGGIVKIVNANKLHAVKGGKKKKRKGR